MNDMLHSLLWEKAQKSLSELVFARRGRPVRPDFIAYYFKKCVRRAGINPKLHFHSLRHTFATWLVQEHVSIYEIQKLLGHSTIAVTQVYSHLGPAELRGAVDKLTVTLS